ncbi:heavy metal translocatin [Lactarius pseudohatsudake]|nr:heavy metal translocatin [Lactarius pseudohatsudake]
MSVHSPNEVTTTVFLSNLHCGSCVRTIEEALQVLVPSPYFIHVSILSQRVIVRHPSSLLSSFIKEAIEDSGFDVADSTVPACPEPSSDPSNSSLRPWRTKKHLEQCLACRNTLETAGVTAPLERCRPPRDAVGNGVTNHPDNVPHHLELSVGGMTCATCRAAVTAALSGLSGVRDVSVSLLGNSAAVTLDNKNVTSDVLETIKAIGYEANIVSVRPSDTETAHLQMDGPLHISLSIGGMTCASCSSTITRLLSELGGITDVSVNLLGNSATLVVESKKLIPEVQDVIESAGYEVTVVNVGPVHAISNASGASWGQRTVALRIEGMFCDQCPQRITQCLEKMSQIIHAEPPTLQDPVLRLTYEPSPPAFTIRDVVSAIVSSSGSPFKVTVHKTLTLEDRARLLQAKEKRGLLYRLGFSVIIAIPAFIISVVFMSLVSSQNPTRRLLMEPMWSGNASRLQWLLLFLATPVMFYSAGSFHRRSLKEIYALWRRGSRTPIWKRFLRFGSMNLLVSSGVSVAYFSSIVLLALAAANSPSQDGHGDTSTYFDSVVFLTMFLLIGRYMEAYSKSRTGDAINSLSSLKPAEALVVGLSDEKMLLGGFRSIEGDIEKGDAHTETEQLSEPSHGSRVQKISADFLELGDIVRVPSGSTPPMDGTIASGQSLFDESSVTGESKPIKKYPGDRVLLGTINVGKVIDVRIDVADGKTMLDHVINVVRDSQTKRAPIERLADHLTGYFVPLVTLFALLVWTIWLSLGVSGVLPRRYLDKDVGGWPVWSLEFAIAVFVVACPCGIGLAAPTALLVGSGLAAKFGILVRGGGEAFQEAAQLDAIAFDKTGTLTVGGQPTVTDSEDFCDGTPWNRETVLGLASEIETSSSHPLATAVRLYCEDKHITPRKATSVEEVPGRGLEATFRDLGCSAIIGNEAWLAEHGTEVPAELSGRLESWKMEAKSVVLLAVRQDDAVETSGTSPFRIVFSFAVADPLRPEAKAVISHLQSQKLATWMISGDNITTAKAVAKQVGIPESNVIAGVLPHEKADKVRWLQENAPKKRRSKLRKLFGKRLNNRCMIAMVGDGINDAPAMAAADVSIAIGSGSDVALSSASFILVSSDLSGVLTLVDLSATVFRRVKFNFLWALVYNIAALPIAAGVLYPIKNTRLDPVWASLAMALSSVSVVCSSLMLRLYKPPIV